MRPGLAPAASLCSTKSYWKSGSWDNVSAPLGLYRAPAVFLESQPQLACVVAAHVAASLQQRRRTCKRPAAIQEVPGVLTSALGVPVEPRRAGCLGVLNPGVLLHHFVAGTSVLALIPGWAKWDVSVLLLSSRRSSSISEKPIGATGFEPPT